MGANDVGVTLAEHDVLGRVRQTHAANPQGSAASVSFGGSTANVAYGSYGARRAARTQFVYQGSVTTTTNDQGRPRKEERNARGELVRVTDAARRADGVPLRRVR